jgi:predicted transcriptional regulator
MGFAFFVLYNERQLRKRVEKTMAQVLSLRSAEVSTRRSAAAVSTRRSAFEIRMDILKVAAEGSAKPTHIMYRANTSWVVMQKNLEFLVGSGFMQVTSGSSRVEYAITERGREVLRDYVSLVDRTAAYPAEVRA